MACLAKIPPDASSGCPAGSSRKAASPSSCTKQSSPKEGQAMIRCEHTCTLYTLLFWQRFLNLLWCDMMLCPSTKERKFGTLVGNTSTKVTSNIAKTAGIGCGQNNTSL
eukprot:3523148-Amphidinium_carterae.1